MSRVVFVLVCLVMSLPAGAELVTFDFDGATATVGGSLPAGSNANVTDYMTDVYGVNGSVTATGAAIWSDQASVGYSAARFNWSDIESGKQAEDQWLRAYGASTNSSSVVPTPGAFQLSFENAILSATADVMVWDEPLTVTAYGSSYGDRFTPTGPFVKQVSFTNGLGLLDLDFGSTAVSLLVFEGNGEYFDFAIDNLAVMPVPVPAAIIIGMLGLGVAGMRLRRYV